MIVGFIHVYAKNNWRSIFDELYGRIVSSQLIDIARLVVVGVVHDKGDSPELGYLGRDKICLAYCLDRPEYEQSLTLYTLWRHCKRFSGHVFYVHTKGVTHKRSPAQDDWRSLMGYFNLNRWCDCKEALKSGDMAGVNWHLGEGYQGASAAKCGGVPVTPHFSGNFWWANNSYIRRLPEPFPIKKSKYECEFWHGLGNPRIAELYHSGVRHHRTRYPKEKYL